MENFVMEYRITDNESREAVFGNAEQYISDVKENWMYMGTFSGMDEFKHSDTREVRKVPVANKPTLESKPTVKVINGAYSFAFEVYTPIPKGVDERDFQSEMENGIVEVGASYLRNALLKRILSLPDSELIEACGCPWDVSIDDIDASELNGGLANSEGVK